MGVDGVMPIQPSIRNGLGIEMDVNKTLSGHVQQGVESQNYCFLSPFMD